MEFSKRSVNFEGIERDYHTLTTSERFDARIENFFDYYEEVRRRISELTRKEACDLSIKLYQIEVSEHRHSLQEEFSNWLCSNGFWDRLGHEVCMGIRHGLFGAHCSDSADLRDSLRGD